MKYGGNVASRETALCIEGYPSCGNSLARALVAHTAPESRLASHSHTVAAVLLAHRYGIPLVLLIRHPEAAIASRASRFGVKLDRAFDEYLWFYSGVERVARTGTCVIDFDQLTTQPTVALRAMLHHAAFAPAIPIDADLVQKVRESMNAWNALQPVADSMKGIPHAGREAMKAELSVGIRSHRDYLPAVDLFHRFQELAR